MGSYNKKCQGCGNWLSSDESDVGYIPVFDETKQFCMRCFKLRNYGKLNKIVDNKTIEDNLANLDPQSNLVILVVNLFDINNSLYEKANEYKNILIVVNNLAALPKNFNEKQTVANLKEFFESKGFYPIDVILYDGLKKQRISSINEYLNQARKLKKKIYFIGKTNVGKSTLINALLKFNKVDRKLTVSPFKNTTMSYTKIKLDKIEIIDTPGFPNEANILNNLNDDDLQFINKHLPCVKNFQISDDEQMFFVEKLFGFKIQKASEECNVAFYLASNFKVMRSKTKPIENVLDNQEMNLISYETKKQFKIKSEVLNSNFKYNLFIPGVAIVKIKGVEKIDIYAPETINYYLTDKTII